MDKINDLTHQLYVILFSIQSVKEMQIFASFYSFAYSFTYVSLIFLYIFLSPLCIISSSLYERALEFAIDIDQQTFALIIILLIVWGISAFFIVDIIRNRTYKSLFFCQFVFYLSSFNFLLIGITYSYLRREDLLEEVLAKILTTMLMIYIAQKIKTKKKDQRAVQCTCTICFCTIQSQQIILNCKHIFHQNCLWNWFYVKNICPTCFKPHNT